MLQFIPQTTRFQTLLSLRATLTIVALVWIKIILLNSPWGIVQTLRQAWNPWKSLTVSIDPDAPQIELQTNNQTPLRYLSNPTVFVVSSSHPLTVSCNDNQSGVQNLQYSIANLTTSVNTSSVSITSSSFTQSHSSVVVNVECIDNVGNSISQNISVILDDEPPVLSTSESGLRDGICVASNWKLFPSSSDNHSDSQLNYSHNQVGLQHLNQCLHLAMVQLQSYSVLQMRQDIQVMYKIGRSTWIQHHQQSKHHWIPQISKLIRLMIA